MTLTEDGGESGILPPGFFFLCFCLSFLFSANDCKKERRQIQSPVSGIRSGPSIDWNKTLLSGRSLRCLPLERTHFTLHTTRGCIAGWPHQEGMFVINCFSFEEQIQS